MITRNCNVYPVETKLGDEFCVMKPHSHKEVSLGLIKEGATRINIDGEEFILNQGDIVLIPPDMVHVCMPVDIKKFNFVMFYIDNEWLSNKIHEDVFCLAPVFASTGSIGCKITSKSKEVKDSVLELIDRFIIIKKRAKITQNNLNEIKTYIDLNYLEDLSLDDIALNYGINKFMLIRKFKKEFKLSPRAYIINQRINLSKDLLKKGLDLTQIALQCGFYDLSHYAKTFKSYTGITPDSFR